MHACIDKDPGGWPASWTRAQLRHAGEVLTAGTARPRFFLGLPSVESLLLG